MACLTCPCSSTRSSTSTVNNPKEELTMEDLIVLDMLQLQNLCANGNLQATGNRATLIDRLLRSFGPQRQKTLAVPPPATELNNNMQVKSKGSSLNAVELAEKVKEDLMRSKGGQVQQSGKMNQNQKLCRTFGHCKTDLDGEEVVKRVERKLASLEARVKNGEGGVIMKQRVELVRSRLQRYFFLAQLLPLSKRPLEFTAFIEKYREQRLKENLVNNDRQGIGDKSRENLRSENQHNEQHTGVSSSWVSVPPNSNQGLVVQHAKGNKQGKWEISETCETGGEVLEELHRHRAPVRGSEAHRHRVWDRYQIILHLSNECWNFFRKWRRRNLVLVEKDTGARVDSTNNAWQTLHISGQKEAVKKLAMVIQTLPGGGIEQSR